MNTMFKCHKSREKREKALVAEYTPHKMESRLISFLMIRKTCTYYGRQSRASRAVKRVIRAAGKTGRVERIATSRSSSGELSSFQTSQTNESDERVG